MADLRPYQREAIEAVIDDLDLARSTLLVLPTGTGKTVCFAEIANRFHQQDRGRVLVLAHREELIRQAVDKIQSWTPLKCEIEMADARAQLDSLYPPDVVVASVQSISRKKRLERFAEFDFSLIIVDEAHHAPASTYRGILDYFAFAKILGVTATPDRGDRAALGQVFQQVAYVYEMRQAIEDGYLVPLVQKAVDVQGLDLSSVRTTAGDLNAGDLEAKLREEEHLHHVADPVAELAAGRKVLIFATTVAHAHDLARVLRGYHSGGSQVTAEALDGSAPPELRARVIDRFRRGETRVLVNCALFTEGFDLPAIDCVAIARPTKSRALYAQMVGRGTRLSPETGKKDLLILDFRGNAGRHKLVTPKDILGGNMTPAVSARADAILEKNPSMPVHQAVKAAEDEIAEMERQALEEQERKKAADEERRKIAVATKKKVREVDPFAVIGSTGHGRAGGGAPSERQIEELRRLGFPAEQNVWALDAQGAEQLITTLRERRKQGKASFKMARLLKKFGFNPDMEAEEAKRIIKTIAANNWRVPPELRAVAG